MGMWAVVINYQPHNFLSELLIKVIFTWLWEYDIGLDVLAANFATWRKETSLNKTNTLSKINPINY